MKPMKLQTAYQQKLVLVDWLQNQWHLSGQACSLGPDPSRRAIADADKDQAGHAGQFLVGVGSSAIEGCHEDLDIFHRPSWPLSVALELKLFMLHSVLLSAYNRDVSLIGSAAPGGLN